MFKQFLGKVLRITQFYGPKKIRKVKIHEINCGRTICCKLVTLYPDYIKVVFYFILLIFSGVPVLRRV